MDKTVEQEKPMDRTKDVPVEPVAYLYEREDGSKDLSLDCNGEYARRLIELGCTETPLFTRPLTAEIADLRAENERLQLDGIHTCHDECQRPTCVLRRQLDEAMEALEDMRFSKPDDDYQLGWTEAIDAILAILAKRKQP